MLLMIESGICGGICQSVHRNVRANDKYMDDCDKEKQSSYIMYMDANSLYA